MRHGGPKGNLMKDRFLKRHLSVRVEVTLNIEEKLVGKTSWGGEMRRHYTRQRYLSLHGKSKCQYAL